MGNGVPGVNNIATILLLKDMDIQGISKGRVIEMGIILVRFHLNMYK